MALESLTALHPEMTSQDGGSSSPEATEVEPMETEDKTEVVTSTSDRELGGYVPGRIDRPGVCLLICTYNVYILLRFIFNPSVIFKVFYVYRY